MRIYLWEPISTRNRCSHSLGTRCLYMVLAILVIPRVNLGRRDRDSSSLKTTRAVLPGAGVADGCAARRTWRSKFIMTSTLCGAATAMSASRKLACSRRIGGEGRISGDGRGWWTDERRKEGSAEGVRVYYNDSDPYVCEWARNLIKAKLAPDGVALLASGPPSISSPASTGSRGVLNPALSAWLMGFPSSWLMAAPVKARRGPPS